jgi:drug/metabolite transporter (DMT)-like permease
MNRHDGDHPWVVWMPAVFVLIWSTGFIVARYGMPHSPPFTFLEMRFAFSLLCFGLWIWASKAAWPQDPRQWLHLAVTGSLMHTGYLGGVWAAVKMGMGAGLSALIVGLQPVLTGLWLSSQGGKVRPIQWLGLILGFIGLCLVLLQKIQTTSEVSVWAMCSACVALLSITAGTLYQKRHVVSCDVRTANFIQLSAAALMALPWMLAEQESVQWVPEFWGAMAWSVLGLTLGGSSLLYLLIQRGAAASVTSLMYLVPPCTTIIAWLLFDELITSVTLLGIALAAIGVGLVTRQPPTVK